MDCSTLLPALMVLSITGCSVTKGAQEPRHDMDLHKPDMDLHMSHRRLRRGWIWRQFFVPEEDPAPRTVGQLKSDSDKGDFSIKYILSGEGAGQVFKIDEYSGEIRTLKKLDREEKAFYVLRGQAINRKSAQPVEPESEFIIKVQDINDNMPQFQNEPYVSSIPEMCPIGTTVVQVTATDADDPQHGNNAKLIYSILQGEPYFYVEPKTGVIVTSWPSLDREARETYNVIVEVKDMMGLTGAYSATTTVTISLLDVNDNGPIFQHNLYTFAVAESAPMGTTVGRIKADDSDVGANARMNYSLEEVEGSDTFQIRTDPVTQEGVLLLAKTLDFETRKRFVMAAEAINEHVDTRFLSYSEFQDRTTLKIFVEDVDEPPVFLTQEYEWKIGENVPTGTAVGTVSARDSDAANNPVRYYIDKNTDMKRRFKIDADTGTLTVATSLDRETASWHNLSVIAKETKQNHFFASALVFIKVLDINDNAPQFSEEYQPYICEGVQSGELVQLISAVDRDDPAEGNQFYFSLVPEKRINPNFTIRDNQDNTAVVLTRRSSFTRQDRTQYLLPVVIADSGSPALTSTTTLTIRVCTCQPDGHCPYSGTGAYTLWMGASIRTIIGIMVCLFTVTVLSILMLVVRRHRKQAEAGKRRNVPDQWEEVSEKVVQYTDPGGGGTLEACHTVPMRSYSRRPGRRLRREEVTASIRISFRQSHHIGPEDEAFRQFIQDRLIEADLDLCALPFDSLQTYVYEGTGSPTGSLSSLGSQSNFEQPCDQGTRFLRLAPWHGGNEEETTF